MKKQTALLLAALLLSGTLSACGQEGAEPISTTGAVTAETAAETEPANPFINPGLPDTDWGGREFRVLGRQSDARPQFTNFEIYAEGENADVVNDAVYRRNLNIEDKYHVKITQFLYEDPQNYLPKAVDTGDDLYDLVFSELSNVGTSTLSGYTYDLNDVKYIDFTKPWWNPDVNEALSIKDKLFYTTSDFSLRDKSRSYILIFNPSLAETYDLPDMLDAVRGGKWTVDMMNTCIRQVGADLDNNGSMDYTDQYGLVMDSRNSFATFVSACDNMILFKDNNDIPQIVMNTERMVNTIDRVLTLTCNTGYSGFCELYKGKTGVKDHWSFSTDAFAQGRALFITAFSHNLPEFSEKCDFDYTIIPFPKYDEAQKKYLTLADTLAMLFGIPKSCAEPDFSGFMLEALSYASTETTLTAYYDIACKTKYSYVEENAEMLDIIFDGIIFDLGMIFRNSIGLYNILGSTIPAKGENIFASEFASMESESQKALEDLIAAVDAAGS